MKAYLLTAVGVIFLSVIVSLVIPEGKLHKSITFIMRLICIVALIQPVTGLFKISGTSAIENFYDVEYICSVYSEHQSGELGKLLKDEFETDVDCAVTVDCVEGDFKPVKVDVGVYENNAQLFEEIQVYLSELNYINITVYAKSS